MKNLYHLLGSMRFAVAILVVVAIAASIGSVIPQNAGLAAYVSDYGEFWAAALMFFGLTDVYHTVWFGTLLVVMAVSTGVCVVRNTPSMVRQMLDAQDHVNRRFVEGLPTQMRVATDGPQLLDMLRRARYRVATRRDDDGSVLIAARRGGSRRLGYILTHAAIVLITVAAFLNSDLALRMGVLLGHQRIETRSLPVDAVPMASRLSSGTMSYRGQVTLAEKETAEHAIVPIGDGYLIQRLPFAMRLLHFHIERYPNGQPRDFVSDIEIQRPGHAATQHALRVNHPLTVDGVTLYQSGFADGGSTLRLNMLAPDGSATRMEATVGSDVPLLVDHTPWTFQATDLRLDNVQTTENTHTHDTMVRFLHGHSGQVADLGPSIEYLLRDAAGQARTMVSYLRPMTFDGRRYMVSGIRHADDDGFDYVRVPVDADGTTASFERFEQRLRNAEVRAAAVRGTPRAEEVAEVASRALAAFATDGLRGVNALVKATVPEAEQANATALLVGLIARAMPTLAGVNDLHAIQDLLTAHDDLMTVNAPIWILGGSYEQRSASGLQVARQGGDALLACSLLMLAVGVCLQYLVRERRVWIWLDAASGMATVGMRAHRKMPGLDVELSALLARIPPMEST